MFLCRFYDKPPQSIALFWNKWEIQHNFYIFSHIEISEKSGVHLYSTLSESMIWFSTYHYSYSCKYCGLNLYHIYISIEILCSS